MAKRKLPALLTSASQERKSLSIQATLSTQAAFVADVNFPLNAAFVANPDSRELFIKLDKSTVVSLFTGQRYSTTGISGYLVNFA